MFYWIGLRIGLTVCAVVFPTLLLPASSQLAAEGKEAGKYCKKAQSAVFSTVSMIEMEPNSAKPFRAALEATSMLTKSQKKGETRCPVAYLKWDLELIQIVYYFLHADFIDGLQPSSEFGKKKDFALIQLRTSLESVVDIMDCWRSKHIARTLLTGLKETGDDKSVAFDRTTMNVRAGSIVRRFTGAKTAGLKLRVLFSGDVKPSLVASPGYLIQSLMSR